MKMKMEINKGIFYVTENGNEKVIYTTEEEAISGLKNVVIKNPGIDPETIKAMKVDTNEENWSLKQIPWVNIAIGLIKSENK